MQSLFHCYYFRSFFVSGTAFARFVMSFNGFFCLFCQVLGALWWVSITVFTEKKYTYICEEHSDRASNKVGFFCVCKLDRRRLLNPFGLKNCQCCLRRLPLKSKEILRMLLGQIIDIWPNGHGRTSGFQALMIRVISF